MLGTSCWNRSPSSATAEKVRTHEAERPCAACMARAIDAEACSDVPPVLAERAALAMAANAGRVVVRPREAAEAGERP